MNGFEVSNSDDIVLAYNESRNNTVGAAILLLPDIFDDRPGAKRIHLVHNYDPRQQQAEHRAPRLDPLVPAGRASAALRRRGRLPDPGNRVENNDFVGIGIADYCATLLGTPFDCSLDPSIPAGFLVDQFAADNTVKGNTLVDNGTNPDPSNPFAFAASDLGLLTLPPPNPPDHGNCYEDNVFTSFFSLFFAAPPPCS